MSVSAVNGCARRNRKNRERVPEVPLQFGLQVRTWLGLPLTQQ